MLLPVQPALNTERRSARNRSRDRVKDPPTTGLPFKNSSSSSRSRLSTFVLSFSHFPRALSLTFRAGGQKDVGSTSAALESDASQGSRRSLDERLDVQSKPAYITRRARQHCQNNDDPKREANALSITRSRPSANHAVHTNIFHHRSLQNPAGHPIQPRCFEPSRPARDSGLKFSRIQVAPDF